MVEKENRCQLPTDIVENHRCIQGFSILRQDADEPKPLKYYMHNKHIKKHDKKNENGYSWRTHVR